MGPYSVCAVSRRCSFSRTILDSQGQDRVRYRVWLYGFPLHLKSTWLAAMLGRDVQQTQVVMLAFSFALLALLSPQSQVPAQPPDIPSFTISVDQPVYSGQPIWVRVVDGPRANIRYPFHAVVGDIGCNRLEVTFNGVLLKPLPIQRGPTTMIGPACGSSAPQGSPSDRLPLHILYQLTSPGIYSVRWTIGLPFPSRNGTAGAKPEPHSDWVTFQVVETTPEQHEAWIKNLLADPPSDDGHLAGDFLPSLLAAAPDPRALSTFVKYLYSDNPMVSGMAASALEEFPQSQVLSAVATALEKQGPSEQLAYFATYHKGWTNEDQVKIVHATIPYLQPGNSAVPSGKQPPPYAPTRTSAAIKLLRFIFYVPNHAWPGNPELQSYVDTQVLQAAPNIMAKANMNAVQELAEYLGSMSSSFRAHELLLQIAERSDNAATQARICLTWHPQSEDLSHLAAVLIAPGDADSLGTDRSSLPYSLVKAYGDNALPYLERAVASSPYVWVRVASAQQLVLHNRPIGFQFLLDQLVQDPWSANRAYKPQLIRWVRDNFRTNLPPDASDDLVTSFLRSRVAELSQQK